MNIIFLTASLWYLSFHGMAGAKDETVSHAPIEQQVFVTRTECLVASKKGAAYLTAHPPVRVSTKAKWMGKCTLKAPRMHSVSELNEIHSAPNHDMPGM